MASPDFRDMNKIIEQFKKKPATQATGNWHLANSQAGNPTPHTHHGDTETRRTAKTFTAENAEGAEEQAQPQREAEGIEQAGGVERPSGAAHASATTNAPLSEYRRENYVQAQDGRMVHKLEMEWQVENRLRKELGVPPEWADDPEKIAWHRRQLALLEKADAAPRCEHIYLDGTTCESPRMRKHKYCYAHARMLEVRPKKLKLLPAEDENSIMWNIMEIQRALIDDEISEKKAGLLLYGQQLALIAVRGVTFKETDGEKMVRSMPKNSLPRMDADDRGSRQEVSREFTRKDANQARDLTAEGAEGAEEQSSPLINADDADRKSKTVEPQRTLRNTEEERTLTAEGGCATRAISGHPPHCAKAARIGDPGDESGKSNVFGDEAGGVGDRQDRKGNAHRGGTDGRRIG